MPEEIVTVFLGRYATIVMGIFPEKFNPATYSSWGEIGARPYPMNPIKAFVQKRFLNAKVLAPPPETIIKNYGELNPFLHTLTGRSIRVVFSDPQGTLDLDSASKIPALITNENEIKTKEIQISMMFNHLQSVWKILDGLNVQDIQDKELLMNLEVAKEAKKRLYSVYTPIDYNRFGGGQR